MTNCEELREAIDKSGLKMGFIAANIGVSPATMTNKVSGRTEFTASEIAKMSDLLKLTRQQRDKIFLSTE